MKKTDFLRQLGGFEMRITLIELALVQLNGRLNYLCPQTDSEFPVKKNRPDIEGHGNSDPINEVES